MEVSIGSVSGQFPDHAPPIWVLGLQVRSTKRRYTIHVAVPVEGDAVCAVSIGAALAVRINDGAAKIMKVNVGA